MHSRHPRSARAPSCRRWPWLPIRRPSKPPACFSGPLLFWFLGLALLGACGGGAPTSLPGTRGGELVAPSLRDTNILLVVVDTLGAAHVGCLAKGSAAGDPGAAAASPTPNLDRIAGEGVLFERAFSTAPWTQPALASLLTSKMPSSHGLTRLFDVLAEEEVSLAENLQAEGFDTAGIVAHDLLASEYGFGQGFDHYDQSSAAGHRAVTSRRVTDLALRWLERRTRIRGGQERPFFLMTHYFDPHFVYQNHPAYDRTSSYLGELTPGMGIWQLRQRREQLDPADLAYLRGLHQEEIAHTDHHIGRLLEGLETLAPSRRTLVIVTADHGEEFMDHGWIGHTRTLFDELLHVPLILYWPGVLEPAAVRTPVSLVDVVPSVMEALGKPPPGDAELDDSARGEEAGRSWWPLLGFGEVSQGRDPAPAAAGGRHIWAEVSFADQPGQPGFHGEKVAFKTALLAGDLKLVHDHLAERWQLFDRARDPHELEPVSPSDPRFRPLQGHLARWESQRRERLEQDRRVPTIEELERLRSLGYVR